MNLLNYVDRYVFAAVGPGIIRDLKLTKAQFGLLGSSFIVIYTVVSPLVGLLGDRTDRRKLLAFGVGLWSLATVAAAFAQDMGQMFLARAVLGVGEASYGVIAPTILADFFATRKRGRIMAIFYLALPVGTAIGYGVGGLMESLGTAHAASIQETAAQMGLGFLGPHLTAWRSAFWVVGLPGIVLALLGLFIRDPGRGASDAVGGVHHPVAPRRPEWGDYLQILKTPSYLYNTAGMAAVTFTTGAFGIWVPAYFEYVHGLQPERKIVLGVALATAGLIGVAISMILPDMLQRRTRKAYLIWAASAVILAVPFGVFGLLADNLVQAMVLLAISSVLMSSCLGPCNTVTANVVPGNQRATGYALSIFLLHLFGDIPSPPLIGRVADWLGQPEGRQSVFGQFFESIGAMPVSDGQHLTNITAGMLVIAPVLLIGAFCFYLGSRHLVRDQEKALARSGSLGADHHLMH
jgi:MFS family permease